MLARRLKQLGIACDVVAPSLTPKGSGDKIKTDRRDARMLARLHRAGELTAVHVPDERDEAIRDLCRARTDAIQDRGGRNQLKAFLLRHGYRYSGSTAWSQAHMRYLRELVLPHPAMKIVLEEPQRSGDSRSAAKPAGQPEAGNICRASMRRRNGSDVWKRT